MPIADLNLRGYSLRAAQTAMRMIAQKAKNTLKSDFELRDLRPEDIGYANPTFNFDLDSTSSYHAIIDNETIATNRWVAIYGLRYSYGTPLISEVKITAGGALKMDRNFEVVEDTQDKSLYFDPVLVEQNTLLKIEGYNKTATTDPAHLLAWVGVVAEKKGQVLAP